VYCGYQPCNGLR